MPTQIFKIIRALEEPPLSHVALKKLLKNNFIKSEWEVIEVVAPEPANPADGENDLNPADCLKGFGEGPHYGGLKQGRGK